MAKKKSGNKRGKPGGKTASQKKASAAARRARQREREKQALRSMGLGMLIIALLCVVFFLPIGGKTIFNHLFEPDPVEEPAPTRPKNLKVSPAVKRAAPMEKVTVDEQESLDNLIQKKSKK